MSMDEQRALQVKKCRHRIGALLLRAQCLEGFN